ncbi:MAG: hypothetical protein E7578_03295 [Ruminococcaceae bacterium]|nr:hypothetical protein [Oscillospiraceae bacterium]
MKRKIISLISAAAMLCSVPAANAADTVILSPRATVAIEDGYVCGITGVPTADFVLSQFECDASLVSPKGEKLTGEAVVPAESIVSNGDTELGKLVVKGDASCDGKINLTDAATILKHVAKWDVTISERSADATSDGKLNLSDVSRLLQFIAKWDVSLGGEYFIDVRDGYKLLANDPEFDAQVVERVKEFAGIDLEVITEAGPGEKFITFGRNLHEKYDFIDKTEVEALVNNSGVATDGLYIDTYAGNIYLTVNDEGDPNTALQFLQMNFDLSGVVDIYCGYYGPVSRMNESGIKYRQAVENIRNSAAVVDGTNGMNEDILIAITNATYTKPKNYIYMIGDGMGKNIVTASEYCHKDDLYGGKMTMNYLPNEGRQSTYSSDQQITDSAAGGTALSTGYKTSNGTIAMVGDHSGTYKTLLELAAERGMSTGVIATKSVTDATPASFTAHVDGRSEEVDIAGQQIAKFVDGTLDLILGGGSAFYDDPANSGALAAAREQVGLTYTKSWDEASSSSLPLAGLFSTHEMPTDGLSNDPHIADMTDFALEMLSQDENGFFLMVEGSKIDTYGHNNDLGAQVDETFEFDCAVAVALRFVALHPDTVLIITADHETGALAIPAEPTEDNIRGSSRYGSGGHHWVDVPVYAVGYNTESLVRTQDNTDIAIFIASLMYGDEFGYMGENQFGYRSDVYNFLDLDDSDTEEAIKTLNKNSSAISYDDDGITVQFSSDFRYLYLPIEDAMPKDEDTMNVAAVRVTYTNKSSKAVYLPALTVRGDDCSSTVGERITYIRPGETMTYTYVLDSNMKNDGLFNSANEMILAVRSGSCDLAITDIDVVNRPFNK